MKIVLEVSPLRNQNLLLHRVRGVGFYINNLLSSLRKYVPNNKYLLIEKGESPEKDIDIIHVPYFEPFFLSLPNIKSAKAVVTVHDLTPLVFPKDFPVGVKGKLKWEVQKIRLKKMDAIITDSKRSKKDIERFTGVASEKIHVVYLAAGEEFKVIKISNEEKIKIQKKHNLPDDFFLYVGDATWNKNLPRIIESCDKAGVNLVMVGKALKEKVIDNSNPWNRDLYTVQKMLESSKNVFALGFVETSDLAMLYNMAKALIMPSIYEGFGLPLVEAMKCGCPVITSQEGSLPEVGGEAVLYVDAYDTESIAKGIIQLAENQSLRKTLSKKGLLQARRFYWQKTALQTAEVYHKV